MPKSIILISLVVLFHSILLGLRSLWMTCFLWISPIIFIIEIAISRNSSIEIQPGRKSVPEMILLFKKFNQLRGCIHEQTF